MKHLDNKRTAAAALRGVHIVDALEGPLVGEGRLLRLLPFAATATICLAVAVPATTWMRPGLAVLAHFLLVGGLFAAILFPWDRVTRQAQLLPPFAFLIGTVMLTSATSDGIDSPFVSLSVLALTWLAIYEHRLAVLLAAMVAGVGFSIVEPADPLMLSTSGEVTTFVFIVVFAGMGVTLHGLVADARRVVTAQREQQIALQQSAAVLDALPERVSRYRISDHVITYCNPAWAAQYGFDPVGRVLDEFLSEDEAVGLHSQLALLSPESPILVDTVPRATPGPDPQWLEWVDRYVMGADGPEVLSIGRDVTRRRKAEMDLAESESRFRDLADKSADVVWRFKTVPTPHFDYMSPSAETIIGYPPSYFLDDFTHIYDILDADSAKAIAQAVNGEQLPDRFDFRFRHANGSIVVGETRTAIIPHGLQGVSRDVTELRRLQDEMSALALRDSLTGLANRRLFNELFEADLARTQRSNLPLAVAFLDLDGFKAVNDAYGHDAGDVVLRETGRRMQKIVRGADTVARLGGDEFVIVYAPNDANSFNLIARIDRALSEPIWITASTPVFCPASIGVADTTVVGYDATALLAAADEAMYEVKRARRALRSDLAHT